MRYIAAAVLMLLLYFPAIHAQDSGQPPATADEGSRRVEELLSNRFHLTTSGKDSLPADKITTYGYKNDGGHDYISVLIEGARPDNATVEAVELRDVQFTGDDITGLGYVSIRSLFLTNSGNSVESIDILPPIEFSFDTKKLSISFWNVAVKNLLIRGRLIQSAVMSNTDEGFKFNIDSEGFFRLHGGTALDENGKTAAIFAYYTDEGLMASLFTNADKADKKKFARAVRKLCAPFENGDTLARYIMLFTGKPGTIRLYTAEGGKFNITSVEDLKRPELYFDDMRLTVVVADNPPFLLRLRKK